MVNASYEDECLESGVGNSFDPVNSFLTPAMTNGCLSETMLIIVLGIPFKSTWVTYVTVQIFGFPYFG